MATLADSLVSSSARRLSIRKRPDLSARRQYYLGKSYWVVKDPVGLNYFRFQDEEYAILEMLDGQTSLDEIKERFEAKFPPQKITVEELQQFLGTLHQSGLVIAGVPGQGDQLHKRRSERRRKEILGQATNILCIRFKGFDPERVLNWLYPKTRWLFQALLVGTSLLLGLSALLLVLVQFDVFRSKLPEFHQFFSPTNALLMAATLGVTKVLHEFGHGLTAKHFGGECHEMGIMFLVLTPCLYCNVSDSWMLPSKWKRAAIGVAGIYVELVIASVCTFIWWFTQPGLLNYICLNVMFICSVSTLLFNGNPLLRYDGYYIAADLMEIPNLRQKASAILNRKLGHWLLGIEPPEDPFLPQRNQVLFAVYSVASAVYRWVVLASIMYFLYKVFEPYRLQIIGHGIIAMSMVGLVGMPLYKLGKFFYIPGRVEKVKRPRAYTSLAVVLLLIAGVLMVPLPHRVFAPVEVRARDAATVYVEVAGTLEEVFVDYGQPVKQGDRLARLSSVDVDLEITQLRGRQAWYDSQLRGLDLRSLHEPALLAQIGPMRAGLEAVVEQLAELEADRDRLTLRAPADGIVLPVTTHTPPEEFEGQLPTWSGSPLDPQNLGCFLEKGVRFCQIGDPKRLEAVVVVDQGDRTLVAPGQRADIKLENLSWRTLRGEIAQIASEPMLFAPMSLSTKAGGDLPTTTDSSGRERPQSTCYEAPVPLDDEDGLLLLGLRGRAKVHTVWQTIGFRLWRFINQTLNFRL